VLHILVRIFSASAKFTKKCGVNMNWAAILLYYFGLHVACDIVVDNVTMLRQMTHKNTIKSSTELLLEQYKALGGRNTGDHYNSGKQ
jgi:hypothetical protein